jgi:hypothetical protein
METNVKQKKINSLNYDVKNFGRDDCLQLPPGGHPDGWCPESAVFLQNIYLTLEKLDE